MNPSPRGDQNSRTPTAIPSLYRKKPVVIQAIQLTNHNLESVAAWCGGEVGEEVVDVEKPLVEVWLEIPTLEGVMRGNLGDYIIKGVSGEFYPCKPDIFELTYEREGLVP